MSPTTLIYTDAQEQGWSPNSNSNYVGESFFHGLDPKGPYVLKAILCGQTSYRESADAKVKRQEVAPEDAFDVIKLSSLGGFEYHRAGNVVKDDIGQFNAYIMYLLVVYGHHINSHYDIGQGPDENVIYDQDHVELIRGACASCKVHGPSLYFNLTQGPGRCYPSNGGTTENVYVEGAERKTVRRLTVGFARIEREFYSVFDIYMTTIHQKEKNYILKLCDVYEAPTQGTC